MDQFLIEYLKSGKAWLLIGSGPSIAMGYPTWKQLAEYAYNEATNEIGAKATQHLDSAMKRKEYPVVFQELANVIGTQRLLQILREQLYPRENTKIYELIARWPVPVYMTTNYDNEISTYLNKLKESYVTYTNSEDHLALLNPDLTGAIVKLHGDLTTDHGLILTESQYRAIQVNESWKFWRTKMTSVFQMMPVIIVGHSLTDKNIRHVLEAAKLGSGVNRPVCWIAPDVNIAEKRQYLEKFGIRVISYPNKSGDHSNLVRMLEHINDFIPPRLTVHLQQQIARISMSPLGDHAAAPGFFVYNKLFTQENAENRRVDILLSVILSAIPRLKQLDIFTVKEALEIAGWPPDVELDTAMSNELEESMMNSGIFEKQKPNGFSLRKHAEETTIHGQMEFEHLKARFKKELRLRILKKYPDIVEADAVQISSDIEASLIGYFREGGLSLATTLFCGYLNGRQRTVVPSSIIGFISQASARYDDAQKRQAFCTISVDIFVHSESAGREYLGRISQGFFAFHALGVYGDVAFERLAHAKDTVWLIDSNVLIGLLYTAP